MRPAIASPGLCSLRCRTAALARLDSNQERKDQNLVCYRYTTGHPGAAPRQATQQFFAWRTTLGAAVKPTAARDTYSPQ